MSLNILINMNQGGNNCGDIVTTPSFEMLPLGLIGNAVHVRIDCKHILIAADIYWKPRRRLF